MIYTEIKEDIREECEKFGEVVDMNIPRPTGGSRQSAGLGKVHGELALSPTPQIGMHDLILLCTDLHSLQFTRFGNTSSPRVGGEEIC